MTGLQRDVVAALIPAALALACWAGAPAWSAAWRIRRAARSWRRDLRRLHSGHVDDLPRTGGPPEPR